jgi:hypothetical protein
MKDLAQQVVAHARDLLLAERFGDIGVDACFYYGAVDISPRYLVVWVLLAGAPDSDLPEWYTPEDRPSGKAGTRAHLLASASSENRPQRVRRRIVARRRER